MSNKSRGRNRIGKTLFPKLSTFENPDALPRINAIFINSATAQLRGRAAFELWRDLGMHVSINLIQEETEADGHFGWAVFRVPDQWHYTFAPVQLPGVARRNHRWDCGCEGLTDVSIIDCHIPLAGRETTDLRNWSPDRRAWFEQNYEDMVDNLTEADLVTVPHRDWADVLLDAHPSVNVYLLPDLTDLGEIQSFMVKLSEGFIAAARHRTEVLRALPPQQCSKEQP